MYKRLRKFFFFLNNILIIIEIPLYFSLNHDIFDVLSFLSILLKLNILDPIAARLHILLILDVMKYLMFYHPVSL